MTRAFFDTITRRCFLPLVAALAVGLSPIQVVELAAQSAAGSPAGAEPTVIILVRHAEKAPAPANDPVLDSTGMRRAEMLLEVVRDAKVAAVYTTPYARTRLTAEPVTKALGLAPNVVEIKGGTPIHVKAVADRVLAEQRGRVSLVVGHSNTVPLIVRALGGSAPDQLEDHEYDNLFIVTIPAAGPVTTVRARYGPANPAVASAPGMK
jgi:broad specificity phosphatase PhoE